MRQYKDFDSHNNSKERELATQKLILFNPRPPLFFALWQSQDLTLRGRVKVPVEEVKSASGRGKSNNNVERSTEMTRSEHANGGDRGLQMVTEEYKLPLVWIDLEMTGLNLEVDRILEIACVITDGNLTKVIEGPDLVIHQAKECLDKMGKWCQTHHGESGLTKKVLKSTISEQEAEKQVADFVKRNISQKYSPLLAGNSVYMDLLFMQKYMPHLASLFSHVLVDVSSVKAICLRWYPIDDRKAPKKEKKHRAMDDIKESIQELRYYKQHIFKAKPKK